MSQAEQKNIWRKEKEQMLRDKQNQPREIRRREVPLSFGDLSKNRIEKTLEKKVKKTDSSADEILRKQLGI